MRREMPREKEAYRDNLRSLLEFTGGKHLMSANDVAGYCGKDTRTVKKLFDFTGYVTVETLARRMSE